MCCSQCNVTTIYRILSLEDEEDGKIKQGTCKTEWKYRKIYLKDGKNESSVSQQTKYWSYCKADERLIQKKNNQIFILSSTFFALMPGVTNLHVYLFFFSRGRPLFHMQLIKQVCSLEICSLILNIFSIIRTPLSISGNENHTQWRKK